MCTTTQHLQWKKITPQNEFSLMLAKNKGAAQGTVFQSKKTRNSVIRMGERLLERAGLSQY